MRVLVIDDSRATRSILGRLLGQLGFEILNAADGREALEVLAAEWPIDLALVDWNMPVLDGLGFVREVRAAPGYADLRLMMVTTEADVEHLATALEAGADEYVMKPFTADVIREKLGVLGVEV